MPGTCSAKCRGDLMLPLPVIQVYQLLPAFLLVVGRISGIMISAPLFGSVAIPVRLKAAFVLALSVAIFPLLAARLPQAVSLPVVLGGLAGELMIGLMVGIGMNIIMMATQLAGTIVGQQAGIALASVFDPNTQSQSSVIGEIYFLTATAIFLIIGGHRAILSLLLDSFAAIPVLTFQAEQFHVRILFELLTRSLELGIRISAPMVIALLLAKACMGFLSRTIPQLHILSVGFAVLVSTGVLISGLEMANLYDVMVRYLDAAFVMLRGALGLDDGLGG